MKKVFLITCVGLIVYNCSGQINSLTAAVADSDQQLNKRQKPQNILSIFPQNLAPVQNVFIITLDGFRWQELFAGADHSLINDEKYTPNSDMINTLYWAATPEERRKKLMPFFWNIIAASGQVYGNRSFDNKVNVANPYAKSYPGYNEIFTGEADPVI